MNDTSHPTTNYQVEKHICNRTSEFTFLIADLEIGGDLFPNLVCVTSSLLPNTHLVDPGRDIIRAKSCLSRVISSSYRICAFAS